MSTIHKLNWSEKIGLQIIELVQLRLIEAQSGFFTGSRDAEVEIASIIQENCIPIAELALANAENAKLRAALKNLSHEVQWQVLNSCSPEEIEDSYVELKRYIQDAQEVLSASTATGGKKE